MDLDRRTRGDRLSRTIRIGADGYMALPMVKQRIKANGLIPAELEAAIAAALSGELPAGDVCDRRDR